MLLTHTSNDLSKFLEYLSEKIKTSALEELLLKFWKGGQMKKISESSILLTGRLINRKARITSFEGETSYG